MLIQEKMNYAEHIKLPLVRSPWNYKNWHFQVVQPEVQSQATTTKFIKLIFPFLIL